MIGFLVRGRVRVKLRIRVRDRVTVGVMFNASVCYWSKCHTFYRLPVPLELLKLLRIKNIEVVMVLTSI